jgi:hypothetical protein
MAAREKGHDKERVGVMKPRVKYGVLIAAGLPRRYGWKEGWDSLCDTREEAKALAARAEQNGGWSAKVVTVEEEPELDLAQTAVLVDVLNGHATVHSLHDDGGEAMAQAELLGEAITRVAVGKIAEGDRVRFSSTECGS